MENSKKVRASHVNKGKNALTKSLRLKGYINDTTTNFSKLESGLDESNTMLAKKWFSLGATRGAIMLAQAIEDKDVKVHYQGGEVFFTFKQSRLTARRRLSIKSGAKLIRSPRRVSINLNTVFPVNMDD